MNSLTISGAIFALIVLGTLAGAFLRRTLPRQHLSNDARDVVRLGAGLIATMGAVVLGLMIASSKTSFDTQNGQVKQITADVILLDNLLAAYGPDAQFIRVELRETIGPWIQRIWQEKRETSRGPYAIEASAEKVYLEVQALAPKTESQKLLQERAVSVDNDIGQMRLLLFAEKDSAIPPPFLIVITFWLIIIFMSFSLFAELNPTVFGFLTLFALSSAAAIYLILELGTPFAGIMMISSEPLMHALAPLPH
jgi:hypothetical protein